jgi:HEPN domain-containing protein
MPSRDEMRSLARARLEDAQVLCKARRYDAAAYMCGYALELALKACICRRLRLKDYPDKELKGAFKTHDFDDLKLLAGLDQLISPHANAQLFRNWSVLNDWRPEWRYRPVGSTSRADAEAMLSALCGPPNGVLRWLRARS